MAQFKMTNEAMNTTTATQQPQESDMVSQRVEQIKVDHPKRHEKMLSKFGSPEAVVVTIKELSSINKFSTNKYIIYNNKP